LATEFCASHDIFSDIPPLVDRLEALKIEEGELVAVGCPCDISAMYPIGGVEEGDFNITITITGLDTGRPKAEGLACLFDDKVQVPAHVVSTDTVLCTVPSLAHLAAVASASQSGQATTAAVIITGRGAAFPGEEKINKKANERTPAQEPRGWATRGFRLASCCCSSPFSCHRPCKKLSLTSETESWCQSS